MSNIFETYTPEELQDYIDLKFEVSSTYSHTHGDLFSELLSEANDYFNNNTFSREPERFEQYLVKFIDILDPHIVSMYQYYEQDNPGMEKLSTQFSTFMIKIINSTDSLAVYDCVPTSNISFDLFYFILGITDLHKIQQLCNSCYANDAYFALTNAIIGSDVPHMDIYYKMSHLTHMFRSVYSLSSSEQSSWFDEHFYKVIIDYISFVSNNIDAIVQFQDDLKYYVCASFSQEVMSDYICNLPARAVIPQQLKSAMFGTRCNTLDILAESLNSAGSPFFWKGADLHIDRHDLTSNIEFYS